MVLEYLCAFLCAFKDCCEPEREWHNWHNKRDLGLEHGESPRASDSVSFLLV